jgi:hypothetical protein
MIGIIVWLSVISIWLLVLVIREFKVVIIYPAIRIDKTGLWAGLKSTIGGAVFYRVISFRK